MLETADQLMEPTTDRLVAHLDRGECYAGNYTGEDIGVAVGRVVEAAHALMGVTTHVNVAGAEYQDRKAYYALLRRSLADPALTELLASLGLLPAAASLVDSDRHADRGSDEYRAGYQAGHQTGRMARRRDEATS